MPAGRADGVEQGGQAGTTAEWVRYADAPPALTDQVRSISAEWVADKGLPEMGFTLGGPAELSGDGVRCLVAVDADRTVHAVTSRLPVHVDGRVVGRTLDFMRGRAAGGATGRAGAAVSSTRAGAASRVGGRPRRG
ncbi:phosphatidylglycerol lysyltransferase domain-containing protein [Actinosynnema sp. CA-248983]